MGIVVSSVSAPIFEKTNIGSLAFWFGLVSCLILLVVVTNRYIKYKVHQTGMIPRLHDPDSRVLK